tara:strand:+ start:1687 stop:2982 length:1296 start_codon:yes stop_codon:yes gene_type:complete
MKKKVVYVGLAADIVHKGHINILKTASKLGYVIVGLLTDKAISSYKKLPYFDFNQRKIILENMKYVNEVIEQKTLDYVENLKKVKPNYVVHGDDWKAGIQKKTRERVIKTIKKWGGKLIEPKYTKNISSSQIKTQISNLGVTPQNRLSKLRRLLNSKKIVRILETHNSLAGLIIENLSHINKSNLIEFDGMWSSSLTDSLTRGKPDNQSVDYSTRILGLNDIMDVTTKPIIFDADNGGRLEHMSYLVKTLERIGVSAMVIEDKIGEKQNSLFENQAKTKQDNISNFCKKLKKAKDSKISEDFFIVARIESFILGKSLRDALNRGEKYVNSGADAILIHSKERKPDEIFDFSRKFKKIKPECPLIAVPSTYSSVKETELIKNGFQIVIYANQMLRAAYPAMTNVAKRILKNERSFEIEKEITPIKEIINLIK